jgi:hypothetical protein
LAEGESAADCRTIWVSGDQKLISVLARAICRRMDTDPPAQLTDLSRRRRPAPKKDGGADDE